MAIFNQYALFYDAFYDDKNYQAECAYIENIIQEFTTKNKISLLDIGCGTGKHARIFGRNDWQILGIDTSPQMIERAKKHETKNLKFYHQSIETANFKNQFNVITALFGVVSYITDNEELNLFFKSIFDNLQTDGIFIFDVWFANGVLYLKPENREKRAYFENKVITRKATSTHFLDKQLIEVCYDFEMEGINQFQEKHLMRYFKLDELKTLLAKNGLEIIRAEGFMKANQAPTKQDWNMTIIAQK
jgi:SAM-dependent methyltransferase